VFNLLITKGFTVKQIIQTLHGDSDAPKGMLADAVRSRLDAKTLAGATLTPLETDLADLLAFDTLSDTAKTALQKRLSKLSLLSKGTANPKTAKDAGLGEVSNWILHLSPSNLSGFNVCPMASKGCRAACLNGAGRGLFDGVQLPRLRKTLYFVKMRELFLKQIDSELTKIEAKAPRGVRVIARLNGTSDLSFEAWTVRDGKNIFDLHPNIQFYDYTKVLARLERVKSIPNYHITFSASETNWTNSLKALALGVNVAVVFRTAALPNSFEGYRVIDGDTHDFRFLDKTGLLHGFIVGLKAKGIAKRDSSGFVRDVAVQVKKTA
jgi:hypothetical protein